MKGSPDLYRKAEARLSSVKALPAAERARAKEAARIVRLMRGAPQYKHLSEEECLEIVVAAYSRARGVPVAPAPVDLLSSDLRARRKA